MSTAADPTPGPARSVAVIGRGRAGGSFALALDRAGWEVAHLAGREPDPRITGAVDLVLIAVPDAEVTAVAGALVPGAAVVAHCAGSLGLAVLEPHGRVASVHPLVSLSSPELGADRLRGAWFAVAGAGPGAVELAHAVVADLGGRAVDVPDDRRVTYHAAAAVASNHLVAVLGQVERLAALAGVPAEAYWDLAAGSLDNVTRLGAAAALTGPVARGDWETVRAHVSALPVDERSGYLAVVALAARLVDRSVPDDLELRA